MFLHGQCYGVKSFIIHANIVLFFSIEVINMLIFSPHVVENAKCGI